jgi:hypothetical protein
MAVMYEGMQGQVPEPEIKNVIADMAHCCQQLGHTVEQAGYYFVSSGPDEGFNVVVHTL